MNPSPPGTTKAPARSRLCRALSGSGPLMPVFDCLPPEESNPRIPLRRADSLLRGAPPSAADSAYHRGVAPRLDLVYYLVSIMTKRLHFRHQNPAAPAMIWPRNRPCVGHVTRTDATCGACMTIWLLDASNLPLLVVLLVQPKPRGLA